MEKLSNLSECYVMKNNRKKQINERLPRPGMLKAGDVVAIPLSDVEFAYARETTCGSLAVLNVVPTTKLESLGALQSIQPVVAFFVQYHEPIDFPDWIFLGNWPYENAEAGFAPPVFLQDLWHPERFQMQHKGYLFDITKTDAMKLQCYEILHPEQVRDRIRAFFAGEWKVTYGLSGSRGSGSLAIGGRHSPPILPLLGRMLPAGGSVNQHCSDKLW